MGEALIEMGSFPDFDRAAVAAACEALRRLPLALRLFTAAADIARVISADEIDDEAAVARVRGMPAAEGLLAVRALLSANTHGSLAKVLAIGRALADALGHASLVQVFEDVGTDVGLLCYLSSRLGSHPRDPGLTLAYLTVALRAGRTDELERVTREPTAAYDPHAVLALLDQPAKDSKLGKDAPSWLADPRPLINVCDRFDLPAELARRLHAHGKYAHLRLYVTKISPSRAPEVVAGMLDAGPGLCPNQPGL